MKQEIIEILRRELLDYHNLCFQPDQGATIIGMRVDFERLAGKIVVVVREFRELEAAQEATNA